MKQALFQSFSMLLFVSPVLFILFSFLSLHVIYWFKFVQNLAWRVSDIQVLVVQRLKCAIMEIFKHYVNTLYLSWISIVIWILNLVPMYVTWSINWDHSWMITIKHISRFTIQSYFTMRAAISTHVNIWSDILLVFWNVRFFSI